MQQFSAMPDFEAKILTGVAGDTLPDGVCGALTESQNWIANKGTIGCFLSHVKAWETISMMPNPFAIVVEDDADVRELNLIRSVAIPDDAEFIFLNDRMSRSWEDVAFEITDLKDTLLRKDIDRIRPGNVDRNGFGSDGYLVTPGAARKLITACKRDLFFGHVDGRLLRYVTAAQDFDNLPDESWIKTIIGSHHNAQRMPMLGLLKGYAVSKPLVRHRNIVSSRGVMDAANGAQISGSGKDEAL